LGLPVIGVVANCASKEDIGLAPGYGYHYGYGSPGGEVYGADAAEHETYALERSVPTAPVVDGRAEMGARVAQADNRHETGRPREERA
jgi:hypothetical protein